jgi:hypothetical protein
VFSSRFTPVVLVLSEAVRVLDGTPGNDAIEQEYEYGETPEYEYSDTEYARFSTSRPDQGAQRRRSGNQMSGDVGR